MKKIERVTYESLFYGDDKIACAIAALSNKINELVDAHNELLETHKHKLKSVGLGAPSRCDCGFSMSDIIQEFLETETVNEPLKSPLNCSGCGEYIGLLAGYLCKRCFKNWENSNGYTTPTSTTVPIPPSNSEKKECCDGCKPYEGDRQECKWGECPCHQTKEGCIHQFITVDTGVNQKRRCAFCNKEEPTTPEKKCCDCFGKEPISLGIVLGGGEFKCQCKCHKKKLPSERISEIQKDMMKELGDTENDMGECLALSATGVEAIVRYLDEQHKKK